MSPLEKIQSTISTPSSVYGYSVKQPFSKSVVFDATNGKTIPAFLFQHGSDPFAVREFLRINRVGSAFDMDVGILVKLPNQK